MKISPFQKLLLRLAPSFGARWLAARTLVSFRDSCLHESGWIESARRGHPCNAAGEPRPWMTYGVTAFLEQRLDPEMSLFEYGSGFSTLFFATRVGSVTSIEYNPAWFDQISRQVPGNASVRFCASDEDGNYCRMVHADARNYDIVLVDGRDRVNCVRQAVERLGSRGVLILDDSQRGRYRDAVIFMRERGFRELPFAGLRPLNHRLGSTTIFYRNDNCLGI